MASCGFPISSFADIIELKDDLKLGACSVLHSSCILTFLSTEDLWYVSIAQGVVFESSPIAMAIGKGQSIVSQKGQNFSDSLNAIKKTCLNLLEHFSTTSFNLFTS